MGVLLGGCAIGSLAVTLHDPRWSIAETTPASAASKPADTPSSFPVTAAVPAVPGRVLGAAAVGDVGGVDTARECRREAGIDTGCVFN